MTEEDAEGRGPGADVCATCGRLVALGDARCPYCGAFLAGASAGRAIRRFLGGRSLTEALFASNILLYVVSLALSGAQAFLPSGGFFSFLGPSPAVVEFLGSVSAFHVLHLHEPWRLLTYAFLHLGIVHIAFNGMAIRSLGPILEEFYGPVRFAIVYLGSAIAGGLAIVGDGAAAAGASGAIFGLLGAGLAYGVRRGGTFGQMVRGEFGRWVLYNVIFTLAVPGISVPGHLGGLAGGFLLGFVLMPPARRAFTEAVSPPWMAILAGALLAAVPLCFGAAIVRGLAFPSPYSARLLGDDPGQRLANWPLEPVDLAPYGAPGWSVGLPDHWDFSRRDGKHFTSSGGLGVGISGLVIADDAATPREVLRVFEDALGEPADPARIVADGESASAEIPLRREGQGGAVPSRLVHVRKLGSGSWLALYSDALPSVHDRGWRSLFDRVVASLRRA